MRGAIFDMDGVLFDTEAIWQNIWNQLAAERGLTLPEQFKKDICGSSDKMPDVIRKYYQTDDYKPISDEGRRRFLAELDRNIPEKPYLHETLTQLKEMGFKIAVASSSNLDLIHKYLSSSNVTGYFDALTSGQEVVHGKPAPDIFLLAAERIGVPIEECYVFEDAYNGIKAAHKAGATPVMIVDLTEPDEEIAPLCHWVTYSLQETLEKIKEENK